MAQTEALLIADCLGAINSVVLGKSRVVELATATLFARGSILIEDRPGLGKTTLAKTLSKVFGLSFHRIQCTNDLLPMDILGRLDYATKEKPRLIEGPIFASLVILDELNRAPARTQSAFLQAMEEGEVTLEGATYALPRPQMFIATQNPADQVGTSFLPESELDRFTIHLQIGYPDNESEKSILRGLPQGKLSDIKEILNKKQVLDLQNQASTVKTSEMMLDLVIRFLNHARAQGAYLSPRVGRDLVRVSQALAFVRGRDHVIPDDLKFCMPAVIGHRTRVADGIIQSFPFEV